MTRSTTVRNTDAKLDRRRRTLVQWVSKADAAARVVADADRALATNARRAAEHEAGLQAAMDEVAARKKMLKADKRERESIRAARKQARDKAAEADSRARAAEGKYDRAVLRDLVRREKERDLREHPAVGVPAVAPLPRGHELPAGTEDHARATQARRTAERAYTATV